MDLEVSAGPALVPSVVGVTQSAATASLRTSGLAVGAVQQVFSTRVAAGVVIRQDPSAGETLTCGTAVNLVVSLGKPPQTPANREIMTQIYDRFSLLDVNNDGKLSLREVLAAMPNLPWELYYTIDISGDEALTLSELQEYLNIGGCLGCVNRLFVKDLLIMAGGDQLLAGLGMALLGAAALRRRG